MSLIYAIQCDEPTCRIGPDTPVTQQMPKLSSEHKRRVRLTEDGWKRTIGPDGLPRDLCPRCAAALERDE